MASIQAERTPNPNSLKFTATDERFFHDDIVAISSKAEADQHELGSRLFSIGGVDDVFITPEFVTVSKKSSEEWGSLQEEIQTTLAAYLDER